MKFDLGRCLLHERLDEAGMTAAELSRKLKYKPERVSDYIENKKSDASEGRSVHWGYGRLPGGGTL
ncbi:hypothetical protein [Paenibacillus sp. DMB20]|uniref:hypothetical protein n=1 Tax=Paenibacillus sp. DMB20 TaxID=1642570 RepID=UPI000AA1AA2E